MLPFYRPNSDRCHNSLHISSTRTRVPERYLISRTHNFATSNIEFLDFERNLHLADIKLCNEENK